MKWQHVKIFGIVSGLLFVFGCAHRRTTQERPQLKTYEAMSGDIRMTVHPLDDYESRMQFKINPRKKKYQPLQIHVDNASEDHYLLHPWHIKIPLVPPKRVARDFYVNVPVAVTLMFFLGEIGLIWYFPLSYFSMAGLVSIFTLPASNRSVKKYLKNGTIERGIESIVIPPRGFVERHIFVVEQEAAQPFTITVINQRTNQPTVFAVSLVDDYFIENFVP